MIRFFFAGILFLILLCPPAFAQSAKDSQPERCGFYPIIYRHLDHIFLSIDYDAVYKEAVECQGNEEACAKKRVHDSKLVEPLDSEISRFIKTEAARLEKFYKGFPKDLSVAHLTALFKSAAVDSLAVFGPNHACPLPTPILLDSSQFNAPPDSSTNALTITLRLEVVQTIPARIAILAITYYRVDAGYTSFLYSRPWMTAIPLSLSESRIREILKDFFDRGLISPYLRSPGEDD